VIRVALYARVSTLAGQDPEMQLRELRAYCERRNLQIVAIQRRWSLPLKPTFGDMAARGGRRTGWVCGQTSL
jgi:hypothetical protein